MSLRSRTKTLLDIRAALEAEASNSLGLPIRPTWSPIRLTELNRAVGCIVVLGITRGSISRISVRSAIVLVVRCSNFREPYAEPQTYALFGGRGPSRC